MSAGTECGGLQAYEYNQAVLTRCRRASINPNPEELLLTWLILAVCNCATFDSALQCRLVLARELLLLPVLEVSPEHRQVVSREALLVVVPQGRTRTAILM